MQIDPRSFDPAAVDPETRKLNQTVEAVMDAAPPLTDLEPAQIRASREAGEGIWGPVVRLEHAESREIPGPGGPIPLRIFRPEGSSRGLYLHLHGGGWTLGAEHHQDVALDRLARETGAVVVSVGYRLAPEHPFPAGPDDCEAAALWLVEKGAAELGGGALLIGGESAGAHLSVLTLLRLRDRHDLRAFAAANLVYGCYDLRFTPSVRRWGARNLILSTPIIEWFTDHFVPDSEQRSDPDVSPLLADLRDLPPALFSVGTEDPLLDDTLFMAGRWQAAGAPAELAVEPGAMHGFDAFPTAQASRANERCIRYLAAALARPESGDN